MTGEAGAQAPDPEQGEVDLVKRRWALAVAIIGWLGTIIGPAIAFDVGFSPSGDGTLQFQSYFMIVSAILFVLAWRQFDRVPAWALGILAVASVGSFLAYSEIRERWTCPYYPATSHYRIVMGTGLQDAPRAYFASTPAATCEQLIEPWGGDARRVWQGDEVEKRFLILFGLYAFAWLTLALLIVGAVRRTLLTAPGGR